MLTQWTNADFDTLGWHDAHIHGMRLITRPDDTFACDLEFDIDYILEWLLQPDRSYNFRLAPATLVFHQASQLRLSLDYTGCGMTPFSISDIERNPVLYEGHICSYDWRFPIDWPLKGEITFNAPAFTQTLRRPPTLHHSQSFTTAERAGC